jgi:16S rRNA C967 or C1407 C5-methylase (RsmB/RsmF family)
MVYSTCSLNPVENEAVIAALLLRANGALVVEVIYIYVLKRAKKNIHLLNIFFSLLYMCVWTKEEVQLSHIINYKNKL